MKRPAPADMRHAAEWLDVYEGTDAEDAASVRRVCEWLRQQAEAAELRAVCRSVGTPVGEVRKYLKELGMVK